MRWAAPTWDEVQLVYSAKPFFRNNTVPGNNVSILFSQSLHHFATHDRREIFRGGKYLYKLNRYSPMSVFNCCNS